MCTEAALLYTRRGRSKHRYDTRQVDHLGFFRDRSMPLKPGALPDLLGSPNVVSFRKQRACGTIALLDLQTPTTPPPSLLCL